MHYKMPMPFREENVQLPNNRSQAVQRLHSLKKRLQADVKYRTDYTNFMSQIIERGYARKMESKELATEEGKVWYPPHNGVCHPQTTSNIRLMFDCSASC